MVNRRITSCIPRERKRLELEVATDHKERVVYEDQGGKNIESEAAANNEERVAHEDQVGVDWGLMIKSDFKHDKRARMKKG